MFKLNLHLCVIEEKQRNEKYILTLSLKSVEVGGYDFLATHVMVPGTSTSFVTV
jgi:hypothetical protein